MKFFKIFITVSTLFISGCGSTLMNLSPDQSIPEVRHDESQVVIMRPSHFGALISASLYDVTKKGVIQFLGIVSSGTKIAVNTTPGKHRFMVVSEAADFMEANLQEGKTHYSIVTPRLGVWKARFSLWPISNDSSAKFNTKSPEFSRWLSKTNLVMQSDEAKAWYESNKLSVEAKYMKYLLLWNQKSPQDIEKRTLKPSDGI